MIRESESPWSSPLVAVKKKSGETRFAVDFRVLNSMCIPDSYPLPRIDETLDWLSRKKVFSILDASAAYWTIPLSEESCELTAFSTPWGLFEFLVMPFGLTSAGAVYSRFIQKVLQDGVDPEASEAYLDDILVGTPDPWEHLEKLREVFEAHRKAGIKLNPSKTTLFEASVEYLGHQVSSEGIRMIPSYVQRICDWPRPKDTQDLRRLIGFFSYYRSFVPHFAEYAAVLNAQRNAEKLEWTPQMEDSLNYLKEAFRGDQVRAYPVFEEG